MHKGGPPEFFALQKHMLTGASGMMFFPEARDGKPRVSALLLPQMLVILSLPYLCTVHSHSLLSV